MNSVEIYNGVAHASSKEMTKRYSTSFNLGIKLLALNMQLPIYSIYGYVRLADEIVDTFHMQDKAKLLSEFRLETKTALERKFSLNPIIHSFQEVVYQYNIDFELIEAFLTSMEMDLEGKEYNEELYKTYIYGSAEVVGLMCLKVFAKGNQEQYETLMPFAKSLGAAFQKVNFLRDFKDDFEKRGRVYFPGVDFSNFSTESKTEIEKDIEYDFEQAYLGIKKLDKDVIAGVYLAYRYYILLFQKIKSESSATILRKRLRVADSRKLLILGKTYVRHTFNLI